MTHVIDMEMWSDTDADDIQVRVTCECDPGERGSRMFPATAGSVFVDAVTDACGADRADLIADIRRDYMPRILYLIENEAPCD